jgi:MraZ protein
LYLRIRSAPVDRFVSRFVNKVDAKGRVSVPAQFRSILSRASAENPAVQPIVYATPVSGLPALDCGGEPLIDEISSLMADLPAFSEARDLLSLELLGGAQEIRIDPDGRIVLPADLRSHAGIEGQAVWVGLGHKFQLWSPDGFAARQAQAQSRVQALKDMLGRSAGPKSPDGPTSPDGGERA